MSLTNPLNNVEKNQLQRMGLIDEYRTRKAEYDGQATFVYKKFVRGMQRQPTDDDLVGIVALELLTFQRFTRFMAKRFPHMPSDEYQIWSGKLARYMVENYKNDIQTP